MQGYFEPTGRLIMSIGRDLIKDLPAAIVELVKNSYDADASFVKITFSKNPQHLCICVEDDGHGMDKETVLGAWMVPSTSYKLKKQVSPKGRIYQGRKGIGRYAVSLLGNKLNLITVKDGYKTFALFDWNEFLDDRKLSEIPIEINTERTKDTNGTRLLIIREPSSFQEEITENHVEKIEKELSKLLVNKMNFEIKLCYRDFFDDQSKNGSKVIEPLPLGEVYHYKLSGIVEANLQYKLRYTNCYTNEIKDFTGNFSTLLQDGKTSCGKVVLDYRVYDKDPSGIDLIVNFINGCQETRFNKTEVKNMLIEQSGISIYRHGFRIRPYGDKSFDWLNLDSKRVQNPSFSIGSEQINGRISIDSEEISGLKEKSARDGLYENDNYQLLQRIAIFALNLLQTERFKHRQRKNKPQEAKPIDRLFDFSEINRNIAQAVDRTYSSIRLTPAQTEEHFLLLKKAVDSELKSLEKEKESEFLEVKEKIAVYQKHTTLGGVIAVVLHEGRKPLSWFNNSLPRMERKLQRLKKNMEINDSNFEDLLQPIKKLKDEAKRLSNFFKRLDPLSSNKRKKTQIINVKEEILAISELFEGYAKDNGVKFILDCQDDLLIKIVQEDLYMAMTNIVENAVFWVCHSQSEIKEITIISYSKENKVVIEIMDTGPGISKDDIQNGLLFIPGFSKKHTVIEENGTGLGLSIAGEAIQRNDGILEAIESSSGAHFRILFNVFGV